MREGTEFTSGGPVIFRGDTSIFFTLGQGGARIFSPLVRGRGYKFLFFKLNIYEGGGLQKFGPPVGGHQNFNTFANKDPRPQER